MRRTGGKSGGCDVNGGRDEQVGLGENYKYNTVEKGTGSGEKQIRDRRGGFSIPARRQHQYAEYTCDTHDAHGQTDPEAHQTIRP